MSGTAIPRGTISAYALALRCTVLTLHRVLCDARYCMCTILPSAYLDAARCPVLPCYIFLCTQRA
eukprot:3268968-Rhodomonas_salina.1